MNYTATAPNTTAQDPVLIVESDMMKICIDSFNLLDVKFDLDIIRGKRRDRYGVNMKRLAACTLFEYGYGPTQVAYFIRCDHATAIYYRTTSHLLKELPKFNRKDIEGRIAQHEAEIQRLKQQLLKYD